MSPDLQIYIDTLILEAICADPTISKQAQSGMVSSLLQKVSEYTKDKLKEVKDSGHKVEMITNFLIPGILTAFGFPFLGFLSKVGQMVFHFDFAKILGEVASSIKELITGGKQTSSAQVDSVVSGAVANNNPPEPTEADINKFIPPAEKAEANPIEKANGLSLREANLLKLAFQEYALNNPNVHLYNPEINIKFAAGLFQSALASFLSSRHKTMKILISVIGWMVKAILASAGFMVAGDAINHIVGGATNPIDGSTQTTSTSTNSEPAPIPTQYQNVFKPSASYVQENNNGPYAKWMIQADPHTIPDILTSWATEIYPDLHGKESNIRSARSFQALVDVLKAYNANGPSNLIFIPKQWKSRKQVVDNFMNEVASTASPAPSNPTPGHPGGTALDL